MCMWSDMGYNSCRNPQWYFTSREISFPKYLAVKICYVLSTRVAGKYWVSHLASLQMSWPGMSRNSKKLLVIIPCYLLFILHNSSLQGKAWTECCSRLNWSFSNPTAYLSSPFFLNSFTEDNLMLFSKP